ncbi:MAG: DUF554 domain-containing protein [Clostridia bacterium]|nr:DUF554 domain-containing protein [Clostridia bacterium]
MIGTLINTSLILLGTLLGLLFRKGIPERVNHALMNAMGLATVLIGMSGALKSQDTLCVILCMGLGAVIGSAINIEEKLNRFGQLIERKLSSPASQEGGIARGFVTATLVYCVGAMAIVGSIDSSIRGDHSTLIAKGIIDGLTAIMFTSTLGIGVGLSAFSVLIYQGTISLLAGFVAPVLTDTMITEMGAVGGLLIAAIGTNMIREKQIPVGNLLPAIFLPLIYLPVAALF